MRLFITAFVVLLFATSVLATDSDRHIYSTRTSPPAGWTIKGRADPTAAVRFFVAIKQQNLDVLESKFWSVSNPKSAEYRQFLSIAEINQIIGSKPADIAAVKNWLLLNGVSADQIASYSDTFEVSTSVSVAERLLQTEFYQFHHVKWGRTVLRQYGSFSVPSYIYPLIDMVLGVSNFPHYRPNRQYKRPVSPAAAYGILPQTVSNQYNIRSQTLQNASSITSQGVVEFEQGTINPDDMAKFSQLIGLPIAPLNADNIVGQNYPPLASSEGSMDIEYQATVNIEAMQWFWIEDSTTWMYGFTTHFVNTDTVPQVISISYGWYEGDQCYQQISYNECKILQMTSDQYVARINTDFQKIALRGVSILTASGDSGAHTRTDEQCEADNLRIEFPASSPYVTAVGGTELITPTPLSPQPQICPLVELTCAGKGIEVAASDAIAGYSSGGGFSEVAAMPDYQTAAVKAYLASSSNLPPATMYNTSMRAIPDVSALGYRNIVYDGISEDFGGTSASAPTFAAIVALLNQVSIAKSGQPLGFLNPLLYQIGAENPAAFNDITIGNNLCTEMGCAASCVGFYAAKGWDAVTGLGSPNYPILAQEVEKLGGRRSEAPVAQW